MEPIKILYAGDSEVGGAANYLLGVLKSFKTKVHHVPPSKKLSTAVLKRPFDVIILSDYPRKQVSRECEKTIVRLTEKGAGFIMVGGWASFSGPFGGWHQSLIEEKILPVVCLNRDDRMNFPGGAHLFLKQAHPMLDSLSFKNSPAIVGVNEVYPKMDSQVLLSTKKIVSVSSKVMLDPSEHPLLVVSGNGQHRTAAWMTDFAPHWCGGLIDWGTKHVKLPVNSKVQIEVGNAYIDFISSMIRWLAGRL